MPGRWARWAQARRAAVALLVVSWVVPSWVARARADEPHPTVTLVYSVEPRVAGCPEESQLRNAVSARLGYDPFRAQASRTVEVRIEREEPRGSGGASGRSAKTRGAGREGVGLRAHVGLRSESGKAAGSRDLLSRRGDCGELASSLTLAISIAIDPLALGATTEPPPPLPATRCPPPPLCPPAPAPVTCPPPEPAPVCPPTVMPPVAIAPAPVERARVGFRAGASLLLALGASPTIASVGVSLRAGLHVGAFSLDVEGRADPPIVHSLDATRGLETTLLLGALVPCYHVRVARLALCAVAGGGVIRGNGVGVAMPARDQSPFVVAGGRLGVEIPLPFYRALHLGLSGDVLAHLTQVTFRLDGQPVYTSPPVSGTLGVGLLGVFP